MASVNKVILVGNLGRDPEVRHAANGSMVVTLNLATTEKFKDRNGNSQESTEWHRVVLFGKLAEIAQTYLHKGSQAYIEGRLQTRSWQDQNNQTRYTTEIVGDRMQMLGSGKGGKSSEQPATVPAQPGSTHGDWDVPFDTPGNSVFPADFDGPPF